MAFNQNVYDFVVANLENPRAIYDAMRSFNVDVNTLADAIGLPANQVTSYFQNAGIQAPGMETNRPAPTQETIAPTNVGNQSEQQIVNDQEATTGRRPAEDVVQRQQDVSQRTEPLNTENTEPVVSQGAGPSEQDIRQQVIRDYVLNIYNDPSLSDAQKAEQINNAAIANNVTRQEIASSLGVDIQNVNTYLDQRAPKEVVSQPTVPVVTEPESRITAALSEKTEATTGREPEVDRRAPRTAAEDYLMNIDPSFSQKLFKPGSQDRYTGTFVKTFKSVDGKLTPVEATPENIASGNLVFYVGGAPSGEYAGENRTAQAYAIQNGKLTPIGAAQSYTAPKEESYLRGVLSEAVPFFAAALLPGVGSAIGQALGVSTQVGTAIANVALQVAQGRPLQDAVIAAGIQFGAPQVFNDPLVAKAVGNIASAAATGQDISKAAINTAVQIGGELGLKDFKPTGDSVSDSMIASALTSGTAAQLTGGNVLQSAISGAVSGAQAGAKATAKPTTIPGGTATVESLPGGGGEADLIAGIPTVPTGGLTLTGGVPGESTVVSTGTQTLEGAQPKTIATQAEANQQNFQYALADYYIQPNGTIWVVDRTTGELSQYQPGQGAVTGVTGGALQKAGSLMGREQQLPADAKYSGSLKTFDPSTYAEGPSSANFGTMAIVGELDPDAPKFNLQITKNADGSTTQINSVTGDRVTFNAAGQIDPARTQYSASTQASQAVGTVSGVIQGALGEYGKSILGALQGAGIPLEQAQAIAKSVEKGGELMQSSDYTTSEKNYIQGNIDAFARYEQTGDKAQLAKDLATNFASNSVGATGLFAKEGVQEVGEFVAMFSPAKVAKAVVEATAGSLESFGAKFDEKYNQLIAQNVPKEEATRQARIAGGYDALVTFLVEGATDLLPGGKYLSARALKEGIGEVVETFIQEKLDGKSNAQAAGNAWTAGLIGGKLTAAASPSGQAVQAVDPTAVATTATSPTNLGTLTVTGKAQPTGVVVNVSGDTALVQFSDGKTSILPSIDPSTGQKVKVGQSVGLDQQGQIVLPASATTTAGAGGNTAVVVAVNRNNNTAAVMPSTGKITFVPAVDTSTGNIVAQGSTVTLTGNQITSSSGGVDTATSDSAGTLVSPASKISDSGGVTTGATTGVVAAVDAATGNALVVTNNGNAVITSKSDLSTGSNVTTGSTVSLNQNNQITSSTTPSTSTKATTSETLTTTPTVTQKVTPTVALTPSVLPPELPPKLPPEKPPELPPEPPLPPTDIVEIGDPILDLVRQEQKPPSIPEPPLAEPGASIPLPEISVAGEPSTQVRTKTVSVPPGQRVTEPSSSGITPTRAALSEREGEDVYGTPEEEQQPVWNVRSLKLRRALRI